MHDTNLDPRTWIKKYGDYLYNFAIARVYDQATAEDLVQETFLSAVKAKNSFEGRSTEKTWLTSILKRKIIDHYRKNVRNKEDKILDNNEHFQREGILKGHWEDEALPNAWEYKETQVLENTEFYKVLQECLQELPERMAATFSMKEIQDYSTEEVCKELDITPSNLWVLMHRAKLKLRKCLEKSWFTPEENY